MIDNKDYSLLLTDLITNDNCMCMVEPFIELDLFPKLVDITESTDNSGKMKNLKSSAEKKLKKQAKIMYVVYQYGSIGPLIVKCFPLSYKEAV